MATAGWVLWERKYLVDMKFNTKIIGHCNEVIPNETSIFDSINNNFMWKKLSLTKWKCKGERGEILVVHMTDQELISLRYKEYVLVGTKKDTHLEEWTKIHIGKWRTEDSNGWSNVGQDAQFH